MGVVVGVAVVEGDGDGGTAAARRSRDPAPRAARPGSCPRASEVRVEQLRWSEVAGIRVDRVVAEDDPTAGLLGAGQDARVTPDPATPRSAVCVWLSAGRGRISSSPRRARPGSQISKRTPASSDTTASAAARLASRRIQHRRLGRPQRLWASRPPPAAWPVEAELRRAARATRSGRPPRARAARQRREHEEGDEAPQQLVEHDLERVKPGAGGRRPGPSARAGAGRGSSRAPCVAARCRPPRGWQRARALPRRGEPPPLHDDRARDQEVVRSRCLCRWGEQPTAHRMVTAGRDDTATRSSSRFSRRS